MKLNNPFDKEVEMPQLSSLIDVLFLLLVFFMLTTTFDKGEGEIDSVDVEIPLANKTHKVFEPDNVLEIFILTDGTFRVADNQEIAADQLIPAIEKAYSDSDKLVVIAGDKDAPYQSVVRVFDVLQRLGIEEFTHVVKTSL